MNNKIKGYVTMGALAVGSVAAVMLATRFLLGTSLSGVAEAVWGKEGLTESIGRGLSPIFTFFGRDQADVERDNRISEFNQRLESGQSVQDAFRAIGINPDITPEIAERNRIGSDGVVGQLTPEARIMNPSDIDELLGATVDGIQGAIFQRALALSGVSN